MKNEQYDQGRKPGTNETARVNKQRELIDRGHTYNKEPTVTVGLHAGQYNILMYINSAKGTFSKQDSLQ